MLDLRVPHGLHMVERVGVGDREAQYHHIRPEGETQDTFSQIKQHHGRAAAATYFFDDSLIHYFLDGL